MGVYHCNFDSAVWGEVNPESISVLNNFILELKQRRKSEKTIYQYRADIRAFLCYVYKEFGNRSILSLTRKEFRRFSLYLIEDQKVSTARHNRVISVLRSMLDYAEMDDDLDYQNNMARRVKGLSNEPVKPIVFLPDEIVLALRDQLTGLGRLQEAALLMMAYDSAGRKGELFQVKKECFGEPSRNNTNQVVGKGRKKFSLLYFSGAKQSVNLWLSCRGADAIQSLWVVSGHPATPEHLYQWFVEMRPILSGMGIESDHFSPHSMRHSALTNYGNGSHYVCRSLGKDGFPIERLRLIAHHDSIDTTQGYLPDTSVDELAGMFNIKMV